METTISSRKVFQGKVIEVRVDTVRLPNGRMSTREIVEHRGAVCLVPIDAQGNVLMVRQYRKAVDATLLEVPAGTLERGEEVLACAQRELQEETGFAAGRLEPLATFYTTPGFSNEVIYAFLATDLRPGALAPEEDEGISVEPVPLGRVHQMIRSGDIKDAKSIAALLLTIARLGNGQHHGLQGRD